MPYNVDRYVKKADNHAKNIAKFENKAKKTDNEDKKDKLQQKSLTEKVMLNTAREAIKANSKRDINILSGNKFASDNKAIGANVKIVKPPSKWR